MVGNRRTILVVGASAAGLRCACRLARLRPPYAPALEPLAVAAMVAQNQLDGVESAGPGDEWGEVEILDVRSREEAEKRPVSPGASTLIPLDELAERLDELDESSRLVVCERGSRSAEAVRLLSRRGLEARYLGGGLRWRAAMGKNDPSSGGDTRDPAE